MKEDINLVLTHEQATIVWLLIANQAKNNEKINAVVSKLHEALSLSDMPKQKDV